LRDGDRNLGLRRAPWPRRAGGRREPDRGELPGARYWLEIQDRWLRRPHQHETVRRRGDGSFDLWNPLEEPPQHHQLVRLPIGLTGAARERCTRESGRGGRGCGLLDRFVRRRRQNPVPVIQCQFGPSTWPPWPARPPAHLVAAYSHVPMFEVFETAQSSAHY